jgi:phage terminase large subunit-like protein
VCPDKVQKMNLKSFFRQNKLFNSGLVMEPTTAPKTEDSAKQIVKFPVPAKDPKVQNAENAAA